MINDCGLSCSHSVCNLLLLSQLETMQRVQRVRANLAFSNFGEIKIVLHKVRIGDVYRGRVCIHRLRNEKLGSLHPQLQKVFISFPLEKMYTIIYASSFSDSPYD